MKNLLSIDPGVSTGVALFRYSDVEPATLEDKWQIEGGIEGFLDWFRDVWEVRYEEATVVAEKFTPLQNAGHNLTMKSVEPLVIEGALVAFGIMPPYQIGGNNPQWQRPSQMYFTGGKTLPEKKKRANAWLKDNGFYVTGKDVGRKDADDVRSAMLHGITWFRAQRHMPTLTAYFRDEG